jgi:hypothetical protein
MLTPSPPTAAARSPWPATELLIDQIILGEIGNQVDMAVSGAQLYGEPNLIATAASDMFPIPFRQREVFPQILCVEVFRKPLRTFKLIGVRVSAVLSWINSSPARALSVVPSSSLHRITGG